MPLWLIDEIECRRNYPKTLDDNREWVTLKTFTHSLHCDGIELCDSITNLEVNDHANQMFICECGGIGCANGNWVCLRSISDQVLWLPDFDSIEHDAESIYPTGNFDPPNYVWSRGVPRVTANAWNSLRRICPSLLPIEKISPLRLGETIRILQMNAPEGLLGKFRHKPVVNLEMMLAVSEGDLDFEVKSIKEIIERYADLQAIVYPIDSATKSIEFHLDLPGFPIWSDIGRAYHGFSFNIASDLVVSAQGDSIK